MAWNPAVASAEIRRALTISSSDESRLAVTDVSTDGSDLIVEQAVDVSELFSPPRMTVRCSRFGLRPGASFDLLEGCDLSSAAGRAQVWAHVKKFAPRVLVASPPCTMFSQLMRTNKPKMERSVWEARRLEAESFLNFCCQLFRYQLEHERFFAFEHPHGADSWSLPMLQQFRQLQGVYFSVFDECRFNLRAPFTNKPIRKRTCWMSNISALHDAFDQKLCECEVEHQPCQGSIEGVRLSTFCQVYTDTMRSSFLEACQRQLEELGPESEASMGVSDIEGYSPSV